MIIKYWIIQGSGKTKRYETFFCIYTKEEVVDLKESIQLEKRRLLRNNEYYEMQSTFDELYKQSCRNYKFKNLMQYIVSEKNILLAYINVKLEM